MTITKAMQKEVERLVIISNDYGYWSKEIQQASNNLANTFGVDRAHLIHALVKKNTNNLGGNL